MILRVFVSSIIASLASLFISSYIAGRLPAFPYSYNLYTALVTGVLTLILFFVLQRFLK